MSRPAGEPGFITCGDWDYLAIETPCGTYYQPHPSRDDWHYTGAKFTARDGMPHDAWCDLGELEFFCHDCAVQAKASVDRDEVTA